MRLRLGLGAALCCALYLAGCGARRASEAEVARGQSPYESDHRFSWPVPGGSLSSGFGMRNGVMHDGVDIAAPIGTPVCAAASGVVIFSGKLRGYGNVVIVRHDGHFVTVYGHNRVNYAHEGDHVTRGQVLGQVGRTGHTTGPNLHFEVRCDNLARNPLYYLPARAAGPTFAASGGSL